MFSGPVSPLADFKDPPIEHHHAGFWRRLFAFIIDAILISIPCYALGALFYSFFYANPVWGMLIGFAIILPYFAILGSSLRGGQTLGHRLMQIQVVKSDGSLVLPRTSFIRYLILLAPLILDADVVLSRLPSAAITGFGMLLSSAELTIFYLYIFNRRTRQSLHDLLTDTFVVDVPGSGRVNVPRFWPWHWVILGGIVLLTVGLPETIVPALMRSASLAELKSIQTNVASSKNLSSVTVVLQDVSSSGGQHTTGIVVSVQCKRKPVDYEMTGSEIAATVLKSDADTRQRDFITVNFVEGFKVGWARYSYQHSIKHTPEEWGRIGK